MSDLTTFFAGAFAGAGLTLSLMFMIFWLTESGESEDDHDEDI